MVTLPQRTIEERLNSIETSLEKLTSYLDQAPGMLSMATDTVDEMLGDARQNGVNIDQRFQDGLKLLERLSAPEMTTKLNGLLDVVEQAPGLVSIVADTADEAIGKINQGSVRLEDRIQAITHLLEKISNPATVEKLDQLMILAEQGPGLVAMAVDALDALMERHGKDLDDIFSFMHKENLMMLKNAGDAFSAARQDPPIKVGGIFGMMRTLKDPDRQKAMSFLMNVLKNFGNKL